MYEAHALNQKLSNRTHLNQSFPTTAFKTPICSTVLR